MPAAAALCRASCAKPAAGVAGQHVPAAGLAGREAEGAHRWMCSSSTRSQRGRAARRRRLAAAAGCRGHTGGAGRRGAIDAAQADGGNASQHRHMERCLEARLPPSSDSRGRAGRLQGRRGVGRRAGRRAGPRRLGRAGRRVGRVRRPRWAVLDWCRRSNLLPAAQGMAGAGTGPRPSESAPWCGGWAWPGSAGPTGRQGWRGGPSRAGGTRHGYLNGEVALISTASGHAAGHSAASWRKVAKTGSTHALPTLEGYTTATGSG